MRSDQQETNFGAITILIAAFVLVLVGISVWFFAYRPAETNVTRIEVQERQPDVQVVPVPDTEYVPVAVPGPTRTIERERTIERHRTIVQPRERDVEPRPAPEPEEQPEPAPDVIDDTDTER